MNENKQRNADRSHSTSESGCAVLIVAALVAGPLLYVLSVGPAVWLANEQYIGGTAVETIYAPLIWLHNNTPLEAPLNWYVELWM